MGDYPFCIPITKNDPRIVCADVEKITWKTVKAATVPLVIELITQQAFHGKFSTYFVGCGGILTLKTRFYFYQWVAHAPQRVHQTNWFSEIAYPKISNSLYCGVVDFIYSIDDMAKHWCEDQSGAAVSAYAGPTATLMQGALKFGLIWKPASPRWWEVAQSSIRCYHSKWKSIGKSYNQVKIEQGSMFTS